MLLSCSASVEDAGWRKWCMWLTFPPQHCIRWVFQVKFWSEKLLLLTGPLLKACSLTWNSRLLGEEIQWSRGVTERCAQTPIDGGRSNVQEKCPRPLDPERWPKGPSAEVGEASADWDFQLLVSQKEDLGGPSVATFNTVGLSREHNFQLTAMLT